MFSDRSPPTASGRSGSASVAPQTQRTDTGPGDGARTNGLPSLTERSVDQRRTEPDVPSARALQFTAIWHPQPGHSVQ